MALPVDTTLLPSWRHWRWVMLGAAAALMVLGAGLAWKFLWPHAGPQQDPAIVEVAAQVRAAREAGITVQQQLKDDPGSAAHRLTLAQLLLDRGDLHGALLEADKAVKAGATPLSARDIRLEAMMRRGDPVPLLAELPALGAGTEADRWRGDALMLKHDWAGAATAYRAALSKDGQSLQARLGLAQALDLAGDVNAAHEQLTTALAQSPQAPEGVLALGVWQARHDTRETARATLRTAASLSGAAGHLQDAASAWALIADLDFADGQYLAAEVAANALARLAPGSEVAGVRLARADLMLNRPARAEERLRAVLKSYPDSADAQFYLGAASSLLGKKEAARMYLGAATVLPDTELAARRLLSTLLLHDGEANETLRVVGSAAEQADGELLALGGRASLLAGDTPAALGYFQHGAAAAPADLRRQLDLAAGLLRANQAAAAVTLLEKLTVPAGQLAEWTLLHTTALVRAGRVAEARAALQTLTTQHAGEAKFQWLAARCYTMAGDLTGAAAALQRVVKLTPQDVEGQAALGLLQLVQGQLAAANASLDQALKLDPKRGEALYAKAQIAALRGQSAEVVEWLTKAAAASPQALLPRLALARLALKGKDLTVAKRRVAEARAVAPANSVAIAVLATELLEAEGDLAGALSAWSKLAEGNPRNVDLHIRLAVSLVQADRLEEALARVKRALAIEETNRAALMLEGDLLLKAGDARTAATVYHKAAVGRPSRALAIREFSVLRTLKDDNAVAPLRRWLEHRPRDIEVRLALASSLSEQHQTAESAAQLEEVLRVQPGHPGAANNLAWLRAEAGDLKAALPLARAAYQGGAHQADFADTYASLLLRSGQKTAALRVLREALTLAPDNATLKSRLQAVTAAP